MASNIKGGAVKDAGKDHPEMFRVQTAELQHCEEQEE
jgi:hypothetical protein